MFKSVYPVGGKVIGITKGAGGASALLLDTLSNVAAAYSLRKLRTAYAGDANRLRRVSDNIESNFGFAANAFDRAGALAFIGGSTGRHTTLYDQVGSLNLTQTIALYQSPYGYSGGIDYVQFEGNVGGVGDGMFSASSSAHSIGNNDFTVAVQFTDDGSLGGMIPVASKTFGYDEWRILGSQFSVYMSGGTRYDATAPHTFVNGEWLTLVAWFDAVGNSINIQINDGTVYTTAFPAGGAADLGGYLRVGTFPSGDWFGLTGKLRDLIIWKSAPGGGAVFNATQRTQIFNFLSS